MGKSAGIIIGDGFGNPEGGYKRKDGRLGSDAEIQFGKLRENTAFHTHHSAYEGVHDHEQGKLFPIFLESERRFILWGSHGTKVALGFGGTFYKWQIMGV